MPRKGENIHKRKDDRWEARYVKGYGEDGKAVYGYVFGKSYLETKRKKSEATTPLTLPVLSALPALPTMQTMPTLANLPQNLPTVDTLRAFGTLPPVNQVHPQLHQHVYQIVQVGGNVNVYSANTANNVFRT